MFGVEGLGFRFCQCFMEANTGVIYWGQRIQGRFKRKWKPLHYNMYVHWGYSSRAEGNRWGSGDNYHVIRV